MKKTSIILDTDPGIDDAVAIAITLFNETIDVKLITTVVGNVSIDKVTYNALKLLRFFEKEIPVAKGASTPLLEPYEDATHIHGLSGLEGFEFEEPDEKLLLKEHAIVAMRDVILNSEEPITIVAIGPLTNIALLLNVYPEVKDNIKEIIFMGGSLTRGNRGVMSEFNIATDPESAKIVINSGLKLSMVGLDIGFKALVLPEDIKKIKKLGKTGDMMNCLFSKYRGGSIKTGLKMYDASAIAYFLNPKMFETQEVFVDIELNGVLTKGTTVVDLKNILKKPANVCVCTDVNGEEFRKWLVEELSKCI